MLFKLICLKCRLKHRYHFSPIRLAKIKNMTTNPDGKNAGKEAFSTLLVGMQTGPTILEGNLVILPKQQEHLSFDQVILLLVNEPEDILPII